MFAWSGLEGATFADQSLHRFVPFGPLPALNS
jgi:hypothetical protein